MIDFRYHLVSIIAIFFALAVGIILGAGPLGEQVDETLGNQLPALRDENNQLRDQIVALEGDIEYQETFLQTVLPELVDGRLSDRLVLLVTMPGADDAQVDRVREDLIAGGGTISGTATIEPAWSEPDSEGVLDELAAQLVTSGTTLPEEGNGYDRGGVVLADALLSAPDTVAESVDAEAAAAFSEAGLVSLDLAEDEQGRNPEATLAVVIAGPPPEDDADRQNDTFRSLVDGLDSAGSGAVAAGPAAAAGEGGLLSSIRDEGGDDTVSTVDSVDLPSGGIAVVFATVEQEAGGAGHYGKVGTTDGALPDLTTPDEAEAES